MIGSAVPFIVAIEGLSGVGKSSLALALDRSLKLAGVSSCVMPCHVDFAGGDEFVPGLASTAEEQREFSGFFLDVERARLSVALSSSPDVVILDRSILSLLAHTSAQRDVGGVDVHNWLEGEIAVGINQNLPVPSLIVVVSVQTTVLKLRRKTLMAGWWNNDEYDAAITSYLSNPSIWPPYLKAGVVLDNAQELNSAASSLAELVLTRISELRR